MYHLLSVRAVKTSLATCMVAVAIPAGAATSILVPVEDLSAATPAVQAQAQNQAQQQNANAELFVLLETLQQEVAQLRGQAEELNFKLRQMEQNQKDRYIDLDRRITDLNTQAAQAASQASSSVQVQPIEATNIAATAPEPAAVVQTESDPAQQQADYKAAFNLIRAKQFEQAIAALLTFVSNYPNGTLTGNAHYWLGEVYMVERDPAAAISQFAIVINQFPEHRKVPDALYKTGRAWINLNDSIKGQRMLEQVIQEYPDSSAARLARELKQ
ncbi:MAG: tol-pal system protein YbgF [Gammaproteobacteria bacterium]|jgi:tol-pal system protein YbgF|nr:tol-pal system protein YbgF [Gammaproteobacteria bacterium]